MDGPSKPTPSSGSNFQQIENRNQKNGYHDSKNKQRTEKKYVPAPPEGRRTHALPENRRRQIKAIDPDSGYASERSSLSASATEADGIDWSFSESEPGKDKQRITDHIARLAEKNGLTSDPESPEDVDYVYKFADSLARNIARKAEYFPDQYNEGLDKHIARPHDIVQKFFLKRLSEFMEEKGVQLFTEYTNRLIKRQIADGLIDDIDRVIGDTESQPSRSKATRYFTKVESLLRQSLEHEFNQGKITPDTIILSIEILEMLKTDNLNLLSQLLEQYRLSKTA
ncbi:hypothetical protein [Endozoicomonas sp. SCSIO W0465]|uniref:hypothetical protein n=1 Tax=Endozoicomonas sp. SCSIO W0465 TaxID=2918516 RepID=UPI00207646B2|nr:hypothetical protein [Endozoicomonas sp. SCSIO W0465]USE35363.1 hypothetical protein MJO57_25195 [Endozoicomonas sp. SCSIO W0465]